MTTPAPAALALKTGARSIMAANRRLPRARFHVTAAPLPDFVASGDDARDIQALTAAITARIEDMVRDNPGQWLWIHQRWPTPRDARLMQAQS